jgi:site-specific recombinase XerC
MINRKNWQLTKKYLEYRFSVDQISKGSLKKEQTHLRYLLQWADDQSFRLSPSIRPTFPEYMLSNRLDGKQGKLSAVYVKKTLATARLFFSWLSDNEIGYKSLKQAWIRTIKVKRLSDAPKTREAVSLDEILAIAAQDAYTLFERRARAAAVFLFLSGMRIGAFVSLPIQAVDIPNRRVIQYPSLGVRTKNKKYGITYLLDIPELLKVVQEWDDEIRAKLPPNGFWFAPLSPDTGKIDPSIVSIGEHRAILARRNMKEWIESKGLPYHSPHKFRHGHIQYGLAKSKDIADYKAVSMNVMHSSMEITDQFYSNLNDEQIQIRINNLTRKNEPIEDCSLELFKQFLEWKRGLG